MMQPHSEPTPDYVAEEWACAINDYLDKFIERGDDRGCGPGADLLRKLRRAELQGYEMTIACKRVWEPTGSGIVSLAEAMDEVIDQLDRPALSHREQVMEARRTQTETLKGIPA